MEGEKASCLALTCRTKSTCTVEPPLLPCENKGFSDPYTTKITPAYHPASSTSRATLSSKVTEPFCRLPLHTFCPKLEAINLEHLLRFVERLDWKLILSLQFSWRTKKAGRRQERCLLFKKKNQKRRARLPPHAESSTGILTGFPFAITRNLASSHCCQPNSSRF